MIDDGVAACAMIATSITETGGGTSIADRAATGHESGTSHRDYALSYALALEKGASGEKRLLGGLHP